MKDTLFLRGLQARAVIGVEDGEQTEPQTLRIDVEMACDASAAAAGDDLEKTVDYRGVAKAILATVEANPCRLIETLAVRLADMIRRDHGVSWVRLRIEKPGAVRLTESVGIEVERGERGTSP